MHEVLYLVHGDTSYRPPQSCCIRADQKEGQEEEEDEEEDPHVAERKDAQPHTANFHAKIIFFS